MGVAVADMDDDGDADVLVVNLEGETDSYHRNDGGYFTDRAAQAGLTVHSRRHTRFGVVAQDFDNDGWLDIYQANGKVDGDLTAAADPFAEPNLLYRGEARDTGVRFSPAQPRSGHGNSIGAHQPRRGGGRRGRRRPRRPPRRQPGQPRLPAHEPHRGGQLGPLSPVGQPRRRRPGAAVFATVGARRIRRDSAPSSSYLASHDPRIHVGLGQSSFARDISVRWPGGAVERFGDFPAGASAVLERGRGAASDGAGGGEISP